MTLAKKTKTTSKGAKKKHQVDPKKKTKVARKKPSKEVTEKRRKLERTPKTLKEKMEATDKWIKRKFCASDVCPHEKCIHHKFLHRCLMPLYQKHKIIPCASLLPWVEIYNLHNHGILDGDGDTKLLRSFWDGVTLIDLAIIELKTEIGRLSRVQKEFLAEQILTGRVMVAVCHGLNDARVFVDAYMKKKADGKTNFYTAAQMQKFCFAGTTTEESILAVLPAKRVEEFLRERNKKWKLTIDRFLGTNDSTSK